MKHMWKYLFWVALFLMSYVYLFYPLLISLLSRILDKKFIKRDFRPSVSIIITAYNEECNIAQKIENVLSLNYPNEETEIIVGSDGSTDHTNDIVRQYETQGVRLVAFKENNGKTFVQNECARKAKHEILIFMDAASLCNEDAIEQIVSNFADDRVGAVAGKIEFVQSKHNLTTQSQGIYWRYEQYLKIAESKLGSLVGVDGPLYAIRKNNYIELQPDIISDLITPLLVIMHGHAVVYEPGAVAYEEATMRTEDEERTRSRIVTRGFTGLFRYPELFNVFSRPMLAWQIISHKILRWMVGFYFFVMFVSTVFLITEVFYLIVLFFFIFFSFLVYRGFKTREKPRALFAVPYYFVLVNWAALRGTVNFILGKRIVTWKPVRN
jgi:cellulose synthase/poly-beta-1,6-N-acetylglucosamine synthase-like glycosyltransferase